MTSPIVFISYHHRDELFKERLLSHLSVLEHSGLLNAWSDDKIAAGANWTAEITQVISRAQVAILLISSNFLSSDFTLQREVPTLLERRLKEGIRIYPIILKPCAWQRVEWLARIQVRPKGGKPLTSFDEDEIDEILADIALEIATLVQFSQAYRGLSEVEFGHIAAEEETRQLQKYFIETAEYSSVISEQGKLLVTGRKGSGKSAIYVTLRDHLPEQDLTAIVEALTLEDYPWEVHKMVMDKGVSIEQAYVNSWKYIIWVILAKKELGYSQIERYRFIDPLFWKLGFNANRRYLIRFLKQNYGSVAPSLTELLADRARQVRSLTIKDFGIGTEKDNDPFQRLSQSINIVNREIEARVLEILSDNKYYLLFDQLDLGWDNTEESKHLITGLILAARDVTRAARKK
ncbi:MAG TPA: toll/interleukin-1 receptor domain-containing protein, partial [Anaerolineae bacterium]|nr:toll/interleukin-1 receptor domain-containing protein [Anaerolineae bacterium]